MIIDYNIKYNNNIYNILNEYIVIYFLLLNFEIIYNKIN